MEPARKTFLFTHGWVFSPFHDTIVSDFLWHHFHCTNSLDLICLETSVVFDSMPHTLKEHCICMGKGFMVTLKGSS